MKIKFIKVTDADLAQKLKEQGLFCYSQNTYGEWYFKNSDTFKFDAEDKGKLKFTNIMNV